MPCIRVHAQYSHLSLFERGLVTGLEEAVKSNKSINRHMGRSDDTIR